MLTLPTAFHAVRLAAQLADTGVAVASVCYHPAAAIERLTDTLALLHLPEPVRVTPTRPTSAATGQPHAPGRSGAQ